jgi:hypothetical protein
LHWLSTSLPMVRFGHDRNSFGSLILDGELRPEVEECIGFVGALTGTEEGADSTPGRTA